MNVVILILGIIFIIIIIIIISLISYNMYKLTHINNEQQNIIKIIEDNNNKRFSNSIFMINVKNIFFRFNNYFINDIYKKLCMNVDTNLSYTIEECDADSTNAPFSTNDSVQVNFYEAFDIDYHKEFNDMWEIIITTIKKIETPFYHKYTDTEIDNIIKEKITLNKVIDIENSKIHVSNQGFVLINAGFKLVDIYMDIISDIINHITDDIELQQSLMFKFKYLIDGIIITFLGENFEDIRSLITSETDNGKENDILYNKFIKTYNKFNEINIKDLFSESVNRYYETPKSRNNFKDLDDITENSKQQFEKIKDVYEDWHATTHE